MSIFGRIMEKLGFGAAPAQAAAPKIVLRKLAENGGNVPQELLD